MEKIDYEVDNDIINDQNLGLEKLWKICFVRLFFANKCYRVSNIGNENKQMWFASNKEVRLMVEIQTLIATIYILYYSLIGVTIIALTSIIALVILLRKSK